VRVAPLLCVHAPTPASRPSTPVDERRDERQLQQLRGGGDYRVARRNGNGPDKLVLHPGYAKQFVALRYRASGIACICTEHPFPATPFPPRNHRAAVNLIFSYVHPSQASITLGPFNAIWLNAEGMRIDTKGAMRAPYRKRQWEVDVMDLKVDKWLYCDSGYHWPVMVVSDIKRAVRSSCRCRPVQARS
jgi:hypothetical protein